MWYTAGVLCTGMYIGKLILLKIYPSYMYYNYLILKYRLLYER